MSEAAVSNISIRNNWDVVLPNYGLSYVFVERLADLERIRPGDFVLVTLNKLGSYQKQIKKWIKRHNQKICLTLDESDEISNPDSQRAKASLDCFRRCRMKLLTTGTSTRNNISEFAPQLELLYNNSINTITWCRTSIMPVNSMGSWLKQSLHAHLRRLPASVSCFLQL